MRQQIHITGGLPALPGTNIIGMGGEEHTPQVNGHNGHVIDHVEPPALTDLSHRRPTTHECNAERKSVLEGVLAKSLSTMTFCITAATDIVAVIKAKAHANTRMTTLNSVQCSSCSRSCAINQCRYICASMRRVLPHRMSMLPCGSCIPISCPRSKVAHYNDTRCNTPNFNHGSRAWDPITSPIGKGLGPRSENDSHFFCHPNKVPSRSAGAPGT